MSGSTLINSFVGEVAGQLVNYTATAAYDVVAVFDSDFNQLFPDARTLTVKVKEAAKLMQHPVESGSLITDHRVIEPIEIELTAILIADTYADTYHQIKGVYIGNDTVAVQTKTGLYAPYLIEKMPHEENPAVFDTIKMTITLKEVLFVTASTSPLPDAPKSLGNKNGNPASAAQTEQASEKVKTQSSVLHGLFN